MIGKIIEICLRKRFLVLTSFGLLIFFGWWAMTRTPIDAIPNIGDMQVIVIADWPGSSPQDVEDQVIYPLTTKLLGIPKIKAIRSGSAFGVGMVNIVFEDGVDYYWARTRVLERLNSAQGTLPMGVMPMLGPDATALGQIFWYTVEGDGYDLSELRSIQDWYVRYQLNSVPGVSEVASVGGYVKQYQIDVDPVKLLAYNINLNDLMMAVQRSNIDIGAKVFEEGGMEFIIRGVGFIKGVKDIEDIAIMASDKGVPVLVKNVAKVTLGPDFRRNALDKEGKETVGGVVLMRYGANPLEVINAVKKKIAEISPGLPVGVKIVPFYDRSGLIQRTINTLKEALSQEILITIFVIVVYMLHFWGSVIISIVLPVGVLFAFLIMHFIGIDANVMSLGGIAIAIGVMVDSGIVMTENIYRHLVIAKAGKNDSQLTAQERLETCIIAAKEVGPAVLTALLTTIIGFIPVFTLTGQSGKLFIPLAYTKTLAMVGAALIAIMLIPTLGYYLLRGRLRSVEDNITSRLHQQAYEPILRWAIRNKKTTTIIAILIMAAGVTGPLIKREFMPPINEGDLLFMPVLLPGTSLTQVLEVMQKQDAIIKNKFPQEVAWVVGKLGRAESATDPAPETMLETIIHLKPEKNWRQGMTREKLIEEIIAATRMPGVSPIMTQPIRNRIDMLATGIQTPVGVKVSGPDLKIIEKLAIQIEQILTNVKGAVSPFAERFGNRPYFSIEINRDKIARYGLRIQDVQDIIMTAIGGENIATTVEGRERYPIRVRYPRELRGGPEDFKKIYVPTPLGMQIPLGELATLKKTLGPAMIASENTMPYARVFVNVNQDEVGLVDFVNNAQKAVQEKITAGELKIPQGYFITWSGQYESEIEARKKLQVVLPITLVVILIILYLAFDNLTDLLIVATGLPISLMGGLAYLYILQYKMSVAVWVGFIALFGVATDNAVLIMAYLQDLFKGKKITSVKEIEDTAVKAGLIRLRPAMMTTMTTIIALIPVIFSTGAGSEVMKPMASPIFGGLLIATASNLIYVPVLYAWKKERQLRLKKEGN
ncbi:MAG: efflux RND transporter permease subunit [Elusimicrobia bacterium]|nr:efflux RND transporter permease subunit [Elusimicrobiota bacterium]